MKLAHRKGGREGIIDAIRIRAAERYVTYPLDCNSHKTKEAMAHVQHDALR